LDRHSDVISGVDSRIGGHRLRLLIRFEEMRAHGAAETQQPPPRYENEREKVTDRNSTP